MPSVSNPARYSFAKRSLAILGVLLPFLLLAMLLGSHGALDNVEFYYVTEHVFAAVLGIGAITLLATVADHYYSGNKLLHGTAIVMAAASTIISLAVASFIYAPQIIRSGDVPPQLILSGSDGDGPAMALVFYTENPTINTVELNGKTLTEAVPSNRHWFKLDLEPGTDNTYSINGQPPVHFKTTAPGKLRFAASGDPHIGAGNSREDLTSKMYGIIRSEGYEEMFLLGDAVQYGFSDAMWKDTLGLAAPTTASIPIGYVPGNHDTMFGGVELFKTYLCQAGQDERSCLMKHIRNGNIDLITIDLEWGVQLYTPEARQWLENELASVPQEHWLIVMSHTFYYSSGSYKDGWAWYDNTETINALVPLFEESHVDLVLSGHKHHAEVLKQNGITYGVIGSFGGVQDDERTYVSPASVWYKAGAYAFADVDIDGNNATLAIRDCNNTVLYETGLQNN